MQRDIAMLMVFVLSVVNISARSPARACESDTAMHPPQMSLGRRSFGLKTWRFWCDHRVMVTAISVASSAAVIFCDGGLKLKVFLYLALTIFISGLSFIIVPGMVAGILKA
jgi:hypothetical protein